MFIKNIYFISTMYFARVCCIMGRLHSLYSAVKSLQRSWTNLLSQEMASYHFSQCSSTHSMSSKSEIVGTHSQQPINNSFLLSSRNLLSSSSSFHSSQTDYMKKGKEKQRDFTTDIQRKLGEVENTEYVDSLFQGLIKQDRASLAKSITLVESTHFERRKEAQLLLSKVLKHMRQIDTHMLKAPPSFRIGKGMLKRKIIPC